MPGPRSESPGGRPPLLALLAGGESSRFPGGKLKARFRGAPLLHHVARAVGRAGVRRILVGTLPAGLSLPPGWEVVADRIKGGGPLAGMAAAAEAAGEGLVVVAADMPFLEAGVLTRLWALSRGGAGAAVRLDRHWVPLVVALRPPAYVPLFELARAKPSPGPGRLLDEIGARAVEPAELGLTPEAARAMFRDVDTPEDLIALAGPP